MDLVHGPVEAGNRLTLAQAAAQTESSASMFALSPNMFLSAEDGIP